jgi:hypothetical protein
MTLYVLPAEASRASLSLPVLRERARRRGLLIAADRTTGTFSLVDARLRCPLVGLDRVGLPDIAQAVELIRNERN